VTYPPIELAVALSTKAKHTEWPFYRAAEHGSFVAQEACIHRDMSLLDQQSTILSLQLLINSVNGKKYY